MSEAISFYISELFIEIHWLASSKKLIDFNSHIIYYIEKSIAKRTVFSLSRKQYFKLLCTRYETTMSTMLVVVLGCCSAREQRIKIES